MKRKQKIIAILICCIVICCSAFVGISFATDAPTFGDIQIKSDYKVGETLTVPVATLSHDGQTKEVGGVIRMPDGSIKDVETLTLTESGKYQIVYKTVVDGKVVSKTVDFCVYNTIISSTGAKSYFTYGTNSYLPETYGLNVCLYPEETITFNKVINVKELTKNKNILKFYVTPQYQGSGELRDFYVRLTDIHNPDNYVTVKYTMFVSETWAWTWTYVTAAAANQNFRGLEYVPGYTGGAASGKYYDEKCNSWYNCSTTGMNTQISWNGNQPVSIWNTTFETNANTLRMDLEENTVLGSYSYYGGNRAFADRVTDLDDAGIYGMNLWNGFTTGEVVVSMWGENFAGGSFNAFFTEIGGYDLSETDFKDETAPEISIDYGIYSAKNVPNVYLNSPYKLFDSVAYDAIDGYVDVDVKVYVNYYGSGKVSIPINDGTFTPKNVGDYTVVYSATDSMGNVKTEVIDLKCVNKENKLNINVGSMIDTVKAGTTVNVAPFTIQNANGISSIKITAKKQGSDEIYQIDASTLEFVPLNVGTYDVVYTAVDYTDTATKTLTLIVTSSDMPVFKDIPESPRFFIKGCSYDLGTPTAYDFSANDAQVFNAKFYVKEDGGAESEVNGKYTVAASSSVEIVVKANNGGQTCSKTVATVPVVDAGYGTKANLSAYFQGDGFSSEFVDSKGVNYSKPYDSENAKLQFINKTLIDGFVYTFSYIENMSDFEKYTVSLTDCNDLTNALNITFTRNENKLVYYFNDDTLNSYSLNFEYGSKVKILYRSKANQVVINNDMTISLGELGSFDGFSGGYAYLDILFSGISDGKAVATQVCNVYDMDFSGTEDFIKPTFYGEKGASNVEINTVYTLKSVEFFDLIDPSVSVYLNVVSKGKYVTAKDGTQLKKADINRDYEIVFDSYGTYTVEYVYSDFSGNSGKYSYVIKILDTEAPTIDFGTDLKTTYKVGEEILFNATVSDNVSTEGFKIRNFVLLPNGQLIQTENTYTFEQAGEYKVYYYVIDEAGNVGINGYNVTVVAES